MTRFFSSARHEKPSWHEGFSSARHEGSTKGPVPGTRVLDHASWHHSQAPFADAYVLGRPLGTGAFGDVRECRRKSVTSASDDSLACQVSGSSDARLACQVSGSSDARLACHVSGSSDASLACQAVSGSSDARLACKVIRKRGMTEDLRRAVASEVQVMTMLKGQHQGVVQLEEVFEGEGELHLVMELCGGGDLFDLVNARGRPLPEHAAREVFVQLASTVEFLHSRGVVHRDIKPENILFKEDPKSLLCYSLPPSSSSNGEVPRVQVKLADFGLSRAMTPGDTTQGPVGSPSYMAPEVIQGGRYGRRADVWSLGVVLAFLLTRKLPFGGRSSEDLVGLRRAICRGMSQVEFDSLACWRGVSAGAKDLVGRMLQVDPVRRIRAHQLLLHPWCASGKLPQDQALVGGWLAGPASGPHIRASGPHIQVSRTEEEGEGRGELSSLRRMKEGAGATSAQGRLQSASSVSSASSATSSILVEGGPLSGVGGREGLVPSVAAWALETEEPLLFSGEEEVCEVTFGEFQAEGPGDRPRDEAQGPGDRHRHGRQGDEPLALAMPALPAEGQGRGNSPRDGAGLEGLHGRGSRHKEEVADGPRARRLGRGGLWALLRRRTHVRPVVALGA